MNLFDKVCYKIGELVCERQEGPLDKVVGGAEVVLGTAGYAAAKVLHKAQAPVGHLMNRKLDMDPISDCMIDCKDLIKEGMERFK